LKQSVAARPNSERPREMGPGQTKDVSPNPANDYHCRDITDLAAQLGC